MGYGSAEVPKMLWQGVFPVKSLALLRFRAPDAEARLFDAKSYLSETLSQIKSIDVEVEAAGKNPENAPGGKSHALWLQLRARTDMVKEKCSEELKLLGSATSRTSAADAIANEKLAKRASKGKWSQVKLLTSKLAAANKSLMAARSRVGRYAFRWHKHVMDAIDLEHQIAGNPPPRVAEKMGVSGCLQRIYWRTRIAAAPPIYAFCAIIAETLSLLLMWSEATIWVCCLVYLFCYFIT
jgi:hypothetical protein